MDDDPDDFEPWWVIADADPADLPGRVMTDLPDISDYEETAP